MLSSLATPALNTAAGAMVHAAGATHQTRPASAVHGATASPITYYLTWYDSYNTRGRDSLLISNPVGNGDASVQLTIGGAKNGSVQVSKSFTVTAGSVYSNT